MLNTSLDTVALGPLGRVTTVLGFGCSGISGGLGRRKSLALLETAYDAGIRHFDVAPMYGFGTAEEVVGEFAFRHAGWITVTTKFGIAPPASGGALNAVRTLVRPMANRVPALRRRLIQRAGAVAQGSAKVGFTALEATRSLEASLRRLRVERLDLFLLHDAEPDDLQDDCLLRMLQDAQDAGKILNFGVGSPAHTIEALTRTHPQYCGVVQHEWSALGEEFSVTNRFHVCHRTIAGAAPVVQQWLQQDAVLQARWSAQVGTDLANADKLAALLLKVSLVLTPGMVLFSSRQAKRIVQNVDVATDESLVAPALRLYSLVRAQLERIRSGHAIQPESLLGATVSP